MEKRFNHLYRTVLLSLMIVLLMTGCQKEVVKSKTVTLEPIESEERIEEFATEEQLDLFLKEIQEEMRVFDVVEYHDELYALIKSEVHGSETDDTLNATIEPIVETYIETILSDKIIESLGENYAQADFDWLYANVETKSLQTLIVAYEREYIKHTTE